MLAVFFVRIGICVVFLFVSVCSLWLGRLVHGRLLCGRSGIRVLRVQCGLHRGILARWTSFLPRVFGWRLCMFLLWAVVLGVRRLGRGLWFWGVLLLWRVFCLRRFGFGLLGLLFRILCRRFSFLRVLVVFAVFLSSLHLLYIVLCKMHMHNI